MGKLLHTVRVLLLTCCPVDLMPTRSHTKTLMIRREKPKSIAMACYDKARMIIIILLQSNKKTNQCDAYVCVMRLV